MTTQTSEAPAPEIDTESPYVGAESFDDDLTPEEQAIYDEEMAEPTGQDTVAVETEQETTTAQAEEAAEVEDSPAATADMAAELEAENADTGATEEEAGTSDASPAQEPPRIPKARLDREMAKRQALEQQLAELKAKQRVEEAVTEEDNTPVDVEIDEEAITKALDMNLDGKNSEAAQIIVGQLKAAVVAGVSQGRTQMRKELEARTEAAVTQAVGQVGAKNAEQEYSTAVTEIEEKYGVFNPDAETFDPDLANRALVMMNALSDDGLSPAEALREAADLTILRHRPELMREKASAPAKEATANAEKARKRNAAAASAQPTRSGGQGTAASDMAINLDTLTDEEFDALPESTLATLRGDAA